MAAENSITLRKVRPDHLTSVIELLRESGYSIEEGDGAMTIHRNGAHLGCNITTDPYPRFPTDMQAQMCALLATTPGLSVIRDTIFPQRFMHCSELKRMGADIDVEDGQAIIRGVESLGGAPVMASDLRASAALVLAGLTAKGDTEIHRLYHIDRGYEHIDEKLIGLGAKIERVPE